MFKRIIYSASKGYLIRDGDLVMLQFFNTGYLALFPNASAEDIKKIVVWLDHSN